MDRERAGWLAVVEWVEDAVQGYVRDPFGVAVLCGMRLGSGPFVELRGDVLDRPWSRPLTERERADGGLCLGRWLLARCDLPPSEEGAAFIAAALCGGRARSITPTGGQERARFPEGRAD